MLTVVTSAAARPTLIEKSALSSAQASGVLLFCVLQPLNSAQRQSRPTTEPAPNRYQEDTPDERNPGKTKVHRTRNSREPATQRQKRETNTDTHAKWHTQAPTQGRQTTGDSQTCRSSTERSRRAAEKRPGRRKGSKPALKHKGRVLPAHTIGDTSTPLRSSMLLGRRPPHSRSTAIQALPHPVQIASALQHPITCTCRKGTPCRTAQVAPPLRKECAA